MFASRPDFVPISPTHLELISFHLTDLSGLNFVAVYQENNQPSMGQFSALTNAAPYNLKNETRLAIFVANQADVARIILVGIGSISIFNCIHDRFINKRLLENNTKNLPDGHKVIEDNYEPDNSTHITIWSPYHFSDRFNLLNLACGKIFTIDGFSGCLPMQK